MTIHKEGYPTIVFIIVFIAIIHALMYFIAGDIKIIMILTHVISLALLFIVLQFFRNPKRTLTINENAIISPADGKVVVIEEVEETEFLNKKCRQISIFMSPFNVHINRFPISGIVKYVKYHPGKYLVAWHPKSSTENERTTVVVEHKNGTPILFRQIAGALARRIVYYCKENDAAQQASEMGFIKFGSRVDVFIPLDAKVKVNLEDKVIGGVSIIAEF
jgi:phosphatidylserine decarboxylase